MNRRGQKKSSGGPAISFMPDDIKRLFEARPPLRPFPLDVAASEESTAPAHESVEGVAIDDAVADDPVTHSALSGVAAFVDDLERGPPPPRPSPPSVEEARRERRSARIAAAAEALIAATAAWAPKKDPNIVGNALATLFVGRLPPECDERRLAAEFSPFGEVVNVRVVRDKAEKSRRYGFVEFAREADVKVSPSS